MLYKAHLAGGFAAGVVAAPIVTQGLEGAETPMMATVIVGSLLGSLLPDIDHKGSYIGRRLPITSSLLGAVVKHRGPTHAPIVVTAVSLLLGAGLYMLTPESLSLWLMLFLIGSYAGTLSHILLDALTVQGVPLLYPFRKKNIRIARLRTGGTMESLFSLFLVVASVIYIFRII